MYSLNIEWDLGQEGLIFASIGASTRWLKANPNVAEMAKDANQTVVNFLLECKADGLISLEPVDIIE
jgi:hypothetical protein|tara:strand:- start:626 stop:826 length:201 start_codon:yes stop_codon:yes gene_type:complete